jgi:hypothetical protein
VSILVLWYRNPSPGIGISFDCLRDDVSSISGVLGADLQLAHWNKDVIENIEPCDRTVVLTSNDKIRQYSEEQKHADEDRSDDMV